MRFITEFVAGETLEANQGAENSTSRKENSPQGGDPNLNSYYCDTVKQFKELEAEIGVAARWTRPNRPNEAPMWCNRWKWKPENGLGWPDYGTDVY